MQQSTKITNLLVLSIHQVHSGEDRAGEDQGSARAAFTALSGGPTGEWGDRFFTCLSLRKGQRLTWQSQGCSFLLAPSRDCHGFFEASQWHKTVGMRNKFYACTGGQGSGRPTGPHRQLFYTCRAGWVSPSMGTAGWSAADSKIRFFDSRKSNKINSWILYFWKVQHPSLINLKFEKYLLK